MNGGYTAGVSPGFARLLDTEREHLLLVYTPADVRFLGIDGQASYRVDARSRVTAGVDGPVDTAT